MKKTRIGQMAPIAALLVCFIALFTTCKNNIVGLGGTIDIKDPTIINDSVYPPNNAIIRGAFTLAVKATDDTSVDAVKVTITDTNNQLIKIGDGFLKKPADKDDYWKLTIDPAKEGYKIGDGAYKVEIQATDSAGKIATVTNGITIDNTPPLLILNRPSTAAGDSSTDVFGADLLLVGQVYDESAVETLKITATEKGKTNTKEITLQSIPQNIRMTVDSFFDKDKKFYEPLYGSNSADGTKNYTYEIAVTDEAKEYKTPGNKGEGTGNTADYYYLYDDLYQDVLSQHKIQDVYRMLSYSSASGWGGRSVAGEAAPAAVATALKKYQIGGSGERASKGTFALNPSVNPTFAIVGENPVARDEIASNAKKLPPLYVGMLLR